MILNLFFPAFTGLHVALGVVGIAAAQVAVLLTFIVVGTLAVRRFHPATQVADPMLAARNTTNPL